MRDLIVTENITLEGVIEATEGWFAPAGGESKYVVPAHCRTGVGALHRAAGPARR